MAADASLDVKKAPADPNPPKLAAPNPYPQFLALRQELRSSKVEIDWAAALTELQRGGFKASSFKDPDVRLSMLIGFRLADGMVSVMAKDSEALRAVAEEVEELADKVGVDRSQLKSANALRESALKGDWAGVVWELGFLQADIMDQLNSGGSGSGMGGITISEPKTVIVALGGFLQGMTYASDIVLRNYSTKDLSNFLRSGKYIEALQARIDALPPDIKGHPQFAVATKALDQIYQLTNIPLDGSINQTALENIASISRQAVAALAKP
jgi:hypothetical protein